MTTSAVRRHIPTSLDQSLILHVLPHHCRTVVVLAEAVTLIERDGPRIGRDDLDMEKVGEVFHDALHEFVADVSALVLGSTRT